MSKQVNLPDTKTVFEYIGDGVVTLAAGAAVNKVFPVSSDLGFDFINMLIVAGAAVAAFYALRRHTFFS